MGQVASSSSYLTSSMKMNLETVMGETWQLVDLFIEWDWETYFTEHGQEDSKYNLGKLNCRTTVISWKKLEVNECRRQFELLIVIKLILC